MTPTRCVIFGVLGSFLLALGLIKAAESFDPVFFSDHYLNADEGLGDPAVLGLS